jgi:hypothetical protein
VPFKGVYDSFSNEYEYQIQIKKTFPLYFKGESSEEADVPDEVTGKFNVNLVPNYNTQFNLKLFKQLFGEPFATEYNKVYICGEAKTHCVKTTIEDLYNTIQEGMSNDNNVLRKAGYTSDELKIILGNIHIIDNVSSSIIANGDDDINTMLRSFSTMRENGVNIVEINDTNIIVPSSMIRAGNHEFSSKDFTLSQSSSDKSTIILDSDMVTPIPVIPTSPSPVVPTSRKPVVVPTSRKPVVVPTSRKPVVVPTSRKRDFKVLSNKDTKFIRLG